MERAYRRQFLRHYDNLKARCSGLVLLRYKIRLRFDAHNMGIRRDGESDETRAGGGSW
jgi:hypothetical protein